ncbi:pyruvate kinase [Neomegalonema perideroedes]|uniref:pyruvate kinase n=1 Tax=Neomegalonema perideroedes TaxID=217219 RepID=UPI0003739A52|nr:pyruvate kinase [Neomegalonema perideroedes]
MRRRRNVKILATLGPSSSDYDQIRALFLAGADVFRLNMSHGSHEDHRARMGHIRALEAETGRPIGVLADLQGPKLRVGVFQDGAAELKEGDAFRLDLDEAPGDAHRAPLPHPEIFAALRPGSTLLVNDGKIRLKIESCGADFAETRVEVGGVISNRKGVNVPDVVLPLAALTRKDKQDLEFACEIGADWIALSFVQRPEDVREAKELVAGRALVMAKIEKPAAVKDLESILKMADGVMVARGDLGVEMPLAQVPTTQKRIVRLARSLGRPVVVATQMLESMIEAPTPTRAEVSDVANAVFEGADAVMLSAESAAGHYPVEAVAVMNDVAVTVEQDPLHRQVVEAARGAAAATTAAAMTAAARQVAETTQLAAICCFSHSGTSAMAAARERPRVPILALTPLLSTSRKLTLVWGLHCVKVPEVQMFGEAVAEAVRAVRAHEFAGDEDKIAIIAGVPFGRAGSTNILRVANVGGPTL